MRKTPARSRESCLPDIAARAKRAKECRPKEGRAGRSASQRSWAMMECHSNRSSDLLRLCGGGESRLLAPLFPCLIVPLALLALRGGSGEVRPATKRSSTTRLTRGPQTGRNESAAPRQKVVHLRNERLGASPAVSEVPERLGLIPETGAILFFFWPVRLPAAHNLCETVAREAHFIFTSDVRRATPTSGDRHPSGERDPRGNVHSPGTQRIARERRYP